MKRSSNWPPYLPAHVSFADLSDERLAFLAAKPELDRRSRSTGWRVIGSTFARGIGRDIAREHAGLVMESYALAVDNAAGDLNVDERLNLRRSGELPAWFFDAVEACRKPPKT